MTSSVLTPTSPRLPRARSFSNASSANWAVKRLTQRPVRQMLCGLCVSQSLVQVGAAASLTRPRQYAIYPLLLHVRLPNPEGLPEQPMSGVMHTTLQRYREWTGSQCDSSRLGILQYGEFYKLQYSTVCILLWIDGSAEIPSQLYVPFRCHHTLLLICFTPSPSSPGCCLSGSTLSN
jgi:hypothetical protein